MSRTISTAALASMYDAETDEVFLILLEINEATLPAPIRYVHNEEDIVSRGNTYYASFFNLELPTEKADSIDSARITVGNVDQTIIEAARTAIGRPTMTVEIVLASDPDSVEVGPFNFELQSVEYDAQTISGVLAYDDVVEVRSPMHTRTPWFFPDLF